MCDYSLQSVQSRPAKVGDKLTVHAFRTGTTGFAAPEDRACAVCVLPGTELAFSEDVIRYRRLGLFWWKQIAINYRMAIFRQFDKDNPYAHHDALEFPNGRTVLVTALLEGQEATVLQLPAKRKAVAEEEAQKRAAYGG
jgi:hypothetical protein